MRGSSGATFEQFDSGTIRKTGIGNGRVLEQGMWLEIYAAPGLPTVYSTGEIVEEDEYLMEKLSPFPLEYASTRSTIAAMVDVLVRDVWFRAPVVALDPDAHAERLRPLMRFIDGEDQVLLHRAFLTVDWDKQWPCLTHGDPIMDNVMMRDDDLVLIDPIPATAAIPDLRCVDLGRLLQSVVGYEAVRYDMAPAPETLPVDWFLKTYCADEDEARATTYFAAVHLLRSLAYVEDDVAIKITTECLAPVLKEMNRWTQ